MPCKALLSSRTIPSNGQHIWFSEGLIKSCFVFKGISLNRDTALQENVAGKEGVTKRTIVWHFLDSFDTKSAEVAETAKLGRDPATLSRMFVRSMQVDCITLWARARCPGWENRIPRAKIIVCWAA
jgi:hypothetical protein